ncbi:hypothetical protein Ddc_00260 [Ditylenchus destructor]|nr:hypothetical protein Ddc_00260 [Ditylenchus destructor]
MPLSINSIATVREDKYWNLESVLQVAGGGVLTKFKRSDDPEGLHYRLVLADGKTVELQRCYGHVSVLTHDPTTNKTRYLSTQGLEESQSK